ncbi:DUF475 domain-containing protein [Oecophyllibacter saccharovorans]|uniref:DUF475 domain-containing protein n=1 Tax=Oecophyllibacter saccharovorans TaxID=2558360 RepID=UPI001145151F|nr:DUF475 domain-containing protein [Oecophyllibacter saccharovorans]QDH14905.1 DUF475 domain-containing protein [Oecophyllibacter saccharovorans]
MSTFRFFRGAFLFTGLCLILGGWLGYQQAHTAAGAVNAVLICLILGVMEVSLSFDNAVVNATILRHMSLYWQRMFLTLGMLVAVFGMRLLFPLIIVALSAHIDPLAALQLALSAPDRYAQVLTGSHTAIMGFGGAFLMLVGLNFFLDQDRDVHWISLVEKPFAHLGQLPGAPIGLTLIAVLLTARFLVPAGQALTFTDAALYGILTWLGVEGIGALLGAEAGKAGAATARSGLASFIYLEVLDASFSFDGVIGAFALSNDLFIITLGLGIGAMFVRSLTVLLVEKGVLSNYRYLEHGAFWAILTLAFIMFLSVRLEVPELVTGCLGGGLILLAFLSSVFWNRAHPEAASMTLSEETS